MGTECEPMQSQIEYLCGARVKGDRSAPRSCRASSCVRVRGTASRVMHLIDNFTHLTHVPLHKPLAPKVHQKAKTACAPLGLRGFVKTRVWVMHILACTAKHSQEAPKRLPSCIFDAQLAPNTPLV